MLNLGKTFAADELPRDRPGAVKRVLAVAALVVSVLAVDTGPADAHQWDGYHWNRGGASMNIYIWDQTGGCGSGGNATNDALYDIYYNPHPIYIYCPSEHTDISMWEANEPGAGFCGLAEIWYETAFWSGHKHITHGHARTNTACGTGKTTKQGVHCQEIGHTLGLDHSNTNDCMGLGYFSGSSGRYYIGSTGLNRYDWDHQTADLYNMYRNHGSHS